jgi:uncharacterized Rmd1/YagE family protein
MQDQTALERRELLSDAPLEHRTGSRLVSESPLAFRAGSSGFVVVFRYGVVVLFGLAATEEDEVLRTLRARAIGTFARPEEETATIELSADHEDHVPPGGPIKLQALTVERLLVIADALPPISFPGCPERWWGDEALKAETDAPQATLEQ